MNKLTIAMLGAGNMGCALSVFFSKEHDVVLYSNSHKEPPFDPSMRLYTEDNDTYTTGQLRCVTESLEEAVSGADYIFITFPSFMFESISAKLIPLLSKGQHLVFVPGSGGVELFFKGAIEKGCTITGLQRVHSVVRMVEPGQLVRQSGIRKSLKAASIPTSFNLEACEVLSQLYKLPVEALDNYLNITMVNSNPILHTSRLYSIFKDYTPGLEYDKLPLFYEEWDNNTSELLIGMDDELFGMFKNLKENGITVDGIIPLLQHYESTDAQSLTNKICSINSFKGLKTPSKTTPNGKYLPDLESRYFTADFPFGLDILLAFSRVTGSKNELFSKVSNWFHDVTKTEFCFDLAKFGITSIDDIKKLYLS